MSLNPPLARSEEPDWFDAMKRPFDELKSLQEKHSCPIFCGGDVFDRWNSNPELINFAIGNMPHIYAVPGQHDLPMHEYGVIYKSAYWTLVEADKITPIEPRITMDLGGSSWNIYGAPWGIKVPKIERGDSKNMLVLHRYVWYRSFSFSGAPAENEVGRSMPEFGNYDVVLSGDNHKGFQFISGKTTVYNAGTFMRRKSDEIDYLPQVGLLQNDGLVISHFLNTSNDIIVKTTEERASLMTRDMQDFLQELQSLDDTNLDFRDAIKAAFEKLKPDDNIKKIILKAMGE